MPAIQRYQCFPQDLAHGKHNLLADVLMCHLALRVPDAANDAVLADAQPIASNFVSPAQLVVVDVNRVGGLATVRAAPVSVPQIAGGPVQMRYVILTNASSGNRLIGFWDVGAAQYFQVGFSITLGDAAIWPVLTLQ